MAASWLCPTRGTYMTWQALPSGSATRRNESAGSTCSRACASANYTSRSSTGAARRERGPESPPVSGYASDLHLGTSSGTRSLLSWRVRPHGAPHLEAAWKWNQSREPIPKTAASTGAKR